MRWLVVLFGMFLFASAPVLAQTDRVEVSGGYSYFSFDQPSTQRLNMNGWALGADFRWKRWIYLVGDFSGDYNTRSSSNPTLNGTRTHMYNYLFGPRIYFLGHRHKPSPYLEGVVGRSRLSIYSVAIPPLPPGRIIQDSLAWSAKFGEEFPISKRFLIRAEAGYFSTDFFSASAGQRNVTASVSLVYHLGVK